MNSSTIVRVFSINGIIRRLALGAAAAAVLLTATMAMPKAAFAGPTFASVDMASVFNKSADKAKADAEMQKLGATLQTAFQGQQQAIMLSNTELHTLGQLYQNPTPTDADKLRLSTLTAQQQAGQQALSDLSSEYHTALDQRSQELNAQINAHMKTIIAQVAAKQGIQVVFDSTVAVYTATDITNDVLALMNK